ncbi:MFS transporter [Chloroflexota bacterium]
MSLIRWPFKIFYGWWIVGAAFFVALCMGGSIVYGFTAIFEPIADEFGWSYAQISMAASLRGVEMGLLAPLVGMLTDRWGPRRLVFSGVVIAAAGLILLSYTTSLIMFYSAFFIISLGISGCMMTVLMTAVSNWFRKKAGVASGIANCGFAFSGLVIPIIVRLIDMYEWRRAVTILALGILTIVLPLSLLFRHKPEQYGYLPDGQTGDTVISDSGSNLSQTIEVDIKVKQALKSKTFWYLALAFTVHFMVLNAVLTHVMPYLSSIGFARVRSSLVASTVLLMGVVGRLGFGWLGDKIDKRLIAVGGFVMVGLGLLCFEYTATVVTWPLVPFVILFGIGTGGTNVMRVTLTREYFGRANFGTVFGLVIGISMIGTIIGPPLAGWVYDNWGSYQGIWFAFAGLAFLALISVLRISRVTTKITLDG